jgi:hypothetical protein
MTKDEFSLAEMTVLVWGPHGSIKRTVKMYLDEPSSVIEAQHLIMSFQNYLDDQGVPYEETQSKSRIRKTSVVK